MTELKITKGITEGQIDQLLSYTHSDQVVQKFTSDPTRFKNRSSAINWLSNVSVYTLADKDGNLVGITWFHQKALPKRKFSENLASIDFPLTFAIRIYGQARGKGMAYSFMKKSFEDFKPGSVWIETSFDNIPVVKIAEKFGFKKVSEPDERGKIIMILDKPE